MSTRRTISSARPFIVAAVIAALLGLGLRMQHTRLLRAAQVYWRYRMNTSADATRSAVQLWLNERQDDDRLLARQAAKASGLFQPGRPNHADVKDMFDFISAFSDARGYRGIWVLRLDGSSVVVSHEADSLPPAVRRFAAEVARSGESRTIGPLRTFNGEQLFAVIEPVVGARDGKTTVILGSVVLGIDPYETLFPTVLDEQDGVENGRNRLVQRIGNDFVVLTPSESPHASPGEIRVPWSRAPVPGRLAAAGIDSSGVFQGLERVPIIAATRHIPESGWGIIRAIEESEALAAANREFRFDALIALVVYLLGIAIAFALRHTQEANRRAAIAESEARYRLLAEHATDLIIRQNMDGDVLYVSPASRALLGYEPAELTAVGPLHFVHPDDEEIARHANEVVFRNPLALPVQYRIRRADGTFAWFETTGQPVIDAERHTLIEIVTVSRDISQRREVEEDGKRLAVRNALLLESAAEGIVGLDHEGTIIFLNPAGERILGWTADELLGKSQHAFLHHSRPDGTPNVQASCGICMTASTGHGHASQDDIFWRRDGTSFPVEYQSTPVRESEGVVGTVVTFRDVGARRRANLELVRAKEEAEAANAAKSEFLARMSHELRTPLNSVIGFSNVLRKNKAGNLKSIDLSYLERIGTNGVQLLALINDILDLSKIEAGKVDLELSVVELGALVEDTLAQLGARRLKAGVGVESVIPPTMKTIETDTAKLRQVLINLVGNAVKFTHAGEVTVSVVVDPNTNRPTRIRVQDTGIGIAPDRIAAVFAAFEQADTSTTREYGGTGLGLSISRALCELLGFRLEVESVLGVGTTFTIELSPAAVATGKAETVFLQPPRALAVSSANGDSDAPLVLVIEDDADARELLRRHVEDLGYRVETASSGAAGLRMAHELRPHLITLDLMMPGMDGWELLKRLAASPQIAHIPVIIVSSIAGEMQDSFVGAVDWIDKPIAHVRLGDAITRNIDHGPGGVLIVEDDPDARELLKRYISDDHKGRLRVANDGASALAMLAHHLPDLIVLDLKMPYVDGFTFLETIGNDARLRDLPVIVVTAVQLLPEQRKMLMGCTIAVLEKGATLEADLARVMRRVPRAHDILRLPISA
ncbi:MAG: response regulator [Gemmatimonadaceae bacterium]